MSEIDANIIFCRYSGNGQTYIARLKGKTASCTCGPEAAARRLAEKIMCGQPYKLKKINSHSYELIKEE